MKVDLNAMLLEGVEAHQKGDLNSAASRYQRILSVAPEHADANHLLGLTLFQGQQTPEAEKLIRKAICIDSKVALYHANLGRVLKSAGQDKAAVQAFRDAVQLEPDNPMLHADLASAMIAAGDADGARARAHLALELAPDLAEGHLNLGLALQELRGVTDSEALACFERALALKPDLAGAHLGLGVGLHEQGNTSEAIQHYQNALTLNPGFVEAHTNLGNIYRLQNQFNLAERHYRSALQIRDDIADIWGNLGVTLQEQGKFEGALEAYDHAIAISPDNAEIRRNRGMARLASGQYETGWADYQYRWKTSRFRQLIRDWATPEWAGETIKGKNIMVHAEQGLGDTIQFARYLQILHERGAVVHFECPSVLHPIFRSAGYLKSLISPGDKLPNFDWHVPLLNLPGLLAPDFAAHPYAESYIDVPVKSSRKWAELTQHWPTGTRIGIAWRGNPDHIRDDMRSPGLAVFAPLFEIDDLVLISLQKENAAEELAALPRHHRLIDPAQEIDDFGDTVALMAHLDIVISCDTAPLHLAGALGRPSIAVLPHVAEWRWGIEGDTTPWYPDMKLIRQPKVDDWDSVVMKIRDELDAL